MPKTVIIINGSARTRESVKMSLYSAGYHVRSAENLAVGLKLCATYKADLVIGDLDTASMDGIALITRLRAMPEYETTPILMFTSGSHEDRKLASRKAGASGWIVKPFTVERLKEIIQEVCPSGDVGSTAPL